MILLPTEIIQVISKLGTGSFAKGEIEGKSVIFDFGNLSFVGRCDDCLCETNGMYGLCHPCLDLIVHRRMLIEENPDPEWAEQKRTKRAELDLVRDLKRAEMIFDQQSETVREGKSWKEWIEYADCTRLVNKLSVH